MTTPPRTPDGRYLIVEGTSGARLWRASNPDLAEQTRQALVDQLMNARRDVRAAAGDEQAMVRARAAVDQAKRALGERGPVWWTDGTPDLNRTLVKNSPYRQWWDSRSTEGRNPGM